MSEDLHQKMMKLHGMNGDGHRMSSMKKVSYEIELKEKKQIADGTMSFVFDKPTDFNFTAGQHLRMTLLSPSETDEKGNSRFLSIASSPQDDYLEVAMRMRDTAFKRELKNMEPGTKVQVQILLNSPHGAFKLHDDVSVPAVFLAGGIGIVPAYSMIKDSIEKQTGHRLILFYSNRQPKDAPYLTELQALAKKNPKFKLVATMSGILETNISWQGELGRITSLMLKQYTADSKQPYYYISGLPEMVSSMKHVLQDTGVEKNRIQAEEYEGFNLNEIVASNPKPKSRLSLFAIVGLVLAFILFHVGGGLAVFQGGLGFLSFDDPLLYLILAVIIISFAAKAKFLHLVIERDTNN